MDEMEPVCLNGKEQIDSSQDISQCRGPMAVITQGGNELIYSYNNVTQSLLRKICSLQEKLEEKDTEILKVKGENERLLERVHELLVGAELREEARESKERSKYMKCSRRGVLQFEILDQTQPQEKEVKRKSKSYCASWFKVTCLFGLAIGTTAFMQDALEI